MGEDLRVVKTKRAVEGAMEKLLAERPFDAITVQAILDEALVNRKTFYRARGGSQALRRGA